MKGLSFSELLVSFLFQSHAKRANAKSQRLRSIRVLVFNGWRVVYKCCRVYHYPLPFFAGSVFCGHLLPILALRITLPSSFVCFL